MDYIRPKYYLYLIPLSESLTTENCGNSREAMQATWYVLLSVPDVYRCTVHMNISGLYRRTSLGSWCRYVRIPLYFHQEGFIVELFEALWDLWRVKFWYLCITVYVATQSRRENAIRRFYKVHTRFAMLDYPGYKIEDSWVQSFPKLQSQSF